MTAASAVYGCHNRPRPTAETTYPAQLGWEYWGLTREPRLVDIPHTLSTDCRYDLSAADGRCSGCVHAAK